MRQLYTQKKKSLSSKQDAWAKKAYYDIFCTIKYSIQSAGFLFCTLHCSLMNFVMLNGPCDMRTLCTAHVLASGHDQGAFNNYLDKMRGKGGKKDGKILSTQLLNDPLCGDEIDAHGFGNHLTTQFFQLGPFLGIQRKYRELGFTFISRESKRIISFTHYNL